MKASRLFLTLVLITLASASAFAQDRFGPETRFTDVLVMVEPGVVQLPPQVPDAAVSAATIRVPEVTGVLAQHGATRVLRSFPGASPADTVLVSKFGHRIRLIDRTKVFRFRFPLNAPLERIAEQLSEAPGIVFAYRIPEYELALMPVGAGVVNGAVQMAPDDPHLGARQWNINHTGQGFQPPVTDGGRADIRALEAWSLFTGSAASRIGIIDSGMRLSHEDLSGKVTGDSHTGNHGTHVGGIAGALTNNSTGIAGVDWHAQLISRNISGFAPETIYNKIISAANAGSHVLNNSWGGTVADHLVRLAFAAVHNANILPIAATHNHAQELTIYPAAFWEVMAVGSSNHENHRSWFSNWGSHLEVVAPGGLGSYPQTADILSTWATSNTQYEYDFGTSMATPHVSGLASLIRGYAQQEHSTTLYHDDLRQIIRRTTDQIRPIAYPYDVNGWNPHVGFGRIDAHQALLMVRDNDILHGVVTGGTVHSSSGQYTTPIFNAPGLAAGNYIVRRHEVRRTVSLSSMNNMQFWARSANDTGTLGWPTSPSYGQNWAELVPGTLTSSSATLRTYVYQIWTITGQYVGYRPTSPANVTFAYTVLGQTAPPPPPLDVYITGSQMMQDGELGTWEAHASGGTGSYSYSWFYDANGTGWWQPLYDTDGNTAWRQVFCAEGTGPVVRVMGTSGVQTMSTDYPIGLLCQAWMAAGEAPPENYALEANYPNPFGGAIGHETQLRFALPQSSHVSLVVYDVLGREVARVVHGILPAGFHRVSVDAGQWTSGTYFYRMEATSVESGERFFQTRPMTLVR